MKEFTEQRDNEEKSTLTYGGANDDRYHLTSTSPFCTSSWASEVEERTELELPTGIYSQCAFYRVKTPAQ